MTTIVYNGRVVAADRQVTRRGVAQHQNKAKIRLPPNPVKYKGHEVLFVSGAGKSTIIDAAAEVVFDGQDPLYFFRMTTKYHMILRSSERTRIMIACKGATYIIRVAGNTDVEIVSIPNEGLPVAIGSGSVGARTLHKMYPAATPLEMLAAAALGDWTGTGNHLDEYDVNTQLMTSHMFDHDELVALAKKATRRKPKTQSKKKAS